MCVPKLFFPVNESVCSTAVCIVNCVVQMILKSRFFLANQKNTWECEKIQFNWLSNKWVLRTGSVLAHWKKYSMTSVTDSPTNDSNELVLLKQIKNIQHDQCSWIHSQTNDTYDLALFSESKTYTLRNHYESILNSIQFPSLVSYFLTY